MAVPKRQVRHAVQCEVVSAVRLDGSTFLLTLACGSQTLKAAASKPKNVRQRCLTCEAKGATP